LTDYNCDRCGKVGKLEASANSDDRIYEVFLKDTPLEYLGDEVLLCRQCKDEMPRAFRIWWNAGKNRP
jgi:hypothetical protein